MFSPFDVINHQKYAQALWILSIILPMMPCVLVWVCVRVCSGVCQCSGKSLLGMKTSSKHPTSEVTGAWKSQIGGVYLLYTAVFLFWFSYELSFFSLNNIRQHVNTVSRMMCCLSFIQQNIEDDSKHLKAHEPLLLLLWRISVNQRFPRVNSLHFPTQMLIFCAGD